MAKRKNQRATGHSDFAGPDAEKDAIEKLAEAARKQNAKGGSNSGVPDEVLDRNLTLIEAAQVELDEKVKEVDELRGVLRNRYKVAKKDGCDNDAIRLYLKLKKRTTGEIVTEHRAVGRILRLRQDPLGTQWNLFAVADEEGGEPSKTVTLDAELAGNAAWRNNEPESNNPWQPGTENHVLWQTGFRDAMATAARKMGNGGAPAAAN